MNKLENSTIICLTPVKNEAWIIERFLKCASIWADVILIADQNSNDKTTSIVNSFPKAKLISNDFTDFNEFKMRNSLLKEARRIKGKRILVSLDADEVLSLNSKSLIEVNELRKFEKGTNFLVPLINIKPDFKNCWFPSHQYRILIDDESDYSAGLIHTEKLPNPIFEKSIKTKEIKIIHYQYTDWKRMESKHRWYQAWEALHFPKKNPIEIYRTYHHMYSIPEKQIIPLNYFWFNKYIEAGIDMFSVQKEKNYYWDNQMLKYFNQFGTKRFSKIAVWENRPWEVEDPRSIWEKVVMWYLKKTQKAHRRLPVRIIDTVLKNIFA